MFLADDERFTEEPDRLQLEQAALKILKGEDSLTEDIFETLLDSVDTDKIMDAVLDSMLGKKK